MRKMKKFDGYWKWLQLPITAIDTCQIATDGYQGKAGFTQKMSKYKKKTVSKQTQQTSSQVKAMKCEHWLENAHRLRGEEDEEIW